MLGLKAWATTPDCSLLSQCLSLCPLCNLEAFELVKFLLLSLRSFLSGSAVIIPDRCTLAHHGQKRNSSRDKTHPDWGGMVPRVCTVHFCKSSCIYYSPLQSVTDSMELKFSWSCRKTRVPVAELVIPGLPQVHQCSPTAEEAAGEDTCGLAGGLSR